MSAKWLELLKEIDPRRERGWRSCAIPTNPASIGQLAAMQGVAPSLRRGTEPNGRARRARDRAGSRGFCGRVQMAD